MQILLIRDNVKAFVKIVGIFTVNGRRQITRGVKRRPVRAQNKAGRHSVLLQIYYLCALALFKQVFSAKLVYYGLHFVGIKTLARIAVEGYIQFFVNGFDVFESKRFKPFEKLARFLITAFDNSLASASISAVASALKRTYKSFIA